MTTRSSRRDTARQARQKARRWLEANGVKATPRRVGRRANHGSPKSAEPYKAGLVACEGLRRRRQKAAARKEITDAI
jgi:hypothetical protein